MTETITEVEVNVKCSLVLQPVIKHNSKRGQARLGIKQVQLALRRKSIENVLDLQA